MIRRALELLEELRAWRARRRRDLELELAHHREAQRLANGAAGWWR